MVGSMLAISITSPFVRYRTASVVLLHQAVTRRARSAEDAALSTPYPHGSVATSAFIRAHDATGQPQALAKFDLAGSHLRRPHRLLSKFRALRPVPSIVLARHPTGPISLADIGGPPPRVSVPGSRVLRPLPRAPVLTPPSPSTAQRVS